MVPLQCPLKWAITFIVVAVCGDFGEGPGIACFHIFFANDRTNDGENFMDEVATWSGPT